MKNIREIFRKIFQPLVLLPQRNKLFQSRRTGDKARGQQRIVPLFPILTAGFFLLSVRLSDQGRDRVLNNCTSRTVLNTSIFPFFLSKVADFIPRRL